MNSGGGGANKDGGGYVGPAGGNGTGPGPSSGFNSGVNSGGGGANKDGGGYVGPAGGNGTGPGPSSGFNSGVNSGDPARSSGIPGIHYADYAQAAAWALGGLVGSAPFHAAGELVRGPIGVALSTAGVVIDTGFSIGAANAIIEDLSYSDMPGIVVGSIVSGIYGPQYGIPAGVVADQTLGRLVGAIEDLAALEDSDGGFNGENMVPRTYGSAPVPNTVFEDSGSGITRGYEFNYLDLMSEEARVNNNFVPRIDPRGLPFNPGPELSNDWKVSDPKHTGVQPILLDLDGNGVKIDDLSRSATFVDAGGDGLKHRTAWAGSGDGVLFFDADNDGAISQKREYVFTEWDPTASSDMEALRAYFDTNGDGKLTSADAAFAQFKVLVTNADGSKVVKTLAERGITEINLTEDATRIVSADGSVIEGQTTFKKSEGSTGRVASTKLVAEADGHRVTDTVLTDASGNRRLRRAGWRSTSAGLRRVGLRVGRFEGRARMRGIGCR